MIPILPLLSKLKLTHFLIIGIGVLIWGFTHYKSKYESEKQTSELRESNFNNILKLTRANDSMRVVNLTFQTDKEVAGYIQQNSTLKNLLSRQGFENERDYRKLEDLTLSRIRYYDSLITSFSATSLVPNIQNGIDGVIKFKDTTDCLNVDSTLEFIDGELTLKNTKKEFTGDILLTRSEGRRTKKFLFFRYGKREVINKASTDCGNVNIQVIEKVDKK